jgi:UDP-glucose 4-epimerase
MTILVTGGAGFIGSHAVLVLLQAGYEVVVVDNLCNSSRMSLVRVAEITGRETVFIQADIRDEAALDRIFTEHTIDCVIHFAGLKAVGESVAHPLEYYDNNIGGSVTLLETMARHNVKQIVFSSSATVYGIPGHCPVTEDHPLCAINPYGRTKLFIEEILRDLVTADPEWRIALLRYFNPVGAHPCGEIGEDPDGIPTNLAPFITQVAVGRRLEVVVFGNDYPTPDGSGVRDYLHVMDLAEAHLAALRKLQSTPGIGVWNLGTGKGVSVLEMIGAFEQTIGRSIPHRIGPRRAGDAAECYCDPTRANTELGWRAVRSLDDICRDAWNWQTRNPGGYRG